MSIRHKALRTIFAAAIAISAVGVVSHQSAPPASADHPNTCNTLGDNSYGYTFDRLSDNVNPFVGVKARLRVQGLKTCTQNGDFAGKSYMLISAQGRLHVGGTLNFPQLGLCKFSNGDTQTRWCYMKPGDLGNPTTAQDKVDFDQDGNSFYDSDDYPVGNREYTLRIRLIDDSTVQFVSHWVWKYYITDDTLGVSSTWKENALGAHSNHTAEALIGEVWWGCEDGPTSSVLGTLTGSNNSVMDNTEYMTNASAPNYYYTKNSTLQHGWNLNPSYYIGNHDNNGEGGDGDRLWCKTNH